MAGGSCVCRACSLILWEPSITRVVLSCKATELALLAYPLSLGLTAAVYGTRSVHSAPVVPASGQDACCSQAVLRSNF